jgi:dihydroxy-acid dehydratase
LTRVAFENAIVVNSAIVGSNNVPWHLNAIARHLGVEFDNDDWERIGYYIPLLVNLQAAGEYLGEDYHLAGGVLAVTRRSMLSATASASAGRTCRYRLVRIVPELPG